MRYHIVIELFSCLALLAGRIQAQRLVDARSSGMGSTWTALPHPSPGLNNPASMAGLDHYCLLIQAESPFLLSELTAGTVSLGVPVKTGVFGIALTSFGQESYRETQTGLTFGKELGRSVRAGIGVHYMHIRQSGDYGNLFAVIPIAGIQVVPAGNWVLGLFISNPANQDYTPHGYRNIPRELRIGAACNLGQDLLCSFDLVSETNMKPYGCAGIEGKYGNRLYFRMGLSSARNSQFSFGLGFRSNTLQADIAVSHHAWWGFSPSLTVQATL